MSAKNYIFCSVYTYNKNILDVNFKNLQKLRGKKKNFDYLFMLLGFPDAQTVKNMPTVQETGV